MSDLSDPSAPAPLSDLDAIATAMSRALARRGPGWPLLWAAAPTALLDHARGLEARSSRGGSATAGAKTLLSAVGAARGSVLTMVGGVLFAYEGANPEATLRPVIEARSGAVRSAPVDHRVRPRPTALVAGLRGAGQVAAATARELGRDLPATVSRALQAAVRATARAEAAFASLTPALVVVASQHSTASRALIQAARARSIPTAYIAHAPVADTYQYRDLPTDHAGLRGPREVEFYRAIGAARDAAIIGNPQGHVDVPDRLDPASPVIFAPRPQPPEQVRAQVALVAAVAPEVVVSPHPRMRDKAAYAGLWPHHWQVHEGWTADLLPRGHPAIIQMSSGVAWEAMAHGVPVLELSSPAAPPPPYLVIREPYARVCRSDTELAAGLAAARDDAADPAARQVLTSWAREWCAADGTDAVALAVAWIEACLADAVAPGPLLDHWAA